MGKAKVLVKVGPEGKYVVDLDKDIDMLLCKPNTRVALRSDSYTLHKILPSKVDPLVSLMKVRAVLCCAVLCAVMCAVLCCAVLCCDVCCAVL